MISKFARGTRLKIGNSAEMAESNSGRDVYMFFVASRTVLASVVSAFCGEKTKSSQSHSFLTLVLVAIFVLCFALQQLPRCHRWRPGTEKFKLNDAFGPLGFRFYSTKTCKLRVQCEYKSCSRVVAVSRIRFRVRTIN